MQLRFAASVAQKLGMAFGAIGVCVVALVITAWLGLQKVESTQARMVDATLPELTALSDINDKLQRLRTSELKHLAALTMPAKDQEEQVINQAVAAFNSRLSAYQALATGANANVDPQLLQQLDAAARQFNATRTEFLQMSNSSAGAEGARAVEAAEFFNGVSQKAYQQAYVAVQALWSATLSHADAEKQVGKAAVAAAHVRLLAVASLVLLLSAALSLLISRQFVQQLGDQPARVASMAAHIADADLSQPIAGSRAPAHSIVAAMARMQAALRDIVGSVRLGAQGVATASQEIAQGNLDLSNRTESQAGALAQTAAAMDALNQIVHANDQRAHQAGALVVHAASVASDGGEVVGRVVATMKGIQEASNRIGDIIGVIDGIAFQTNILALNAAVEAARAGEQGRGFAVVASEVRSLASRSADAAKEIKQLIQASVVQVDQGSALVDQAGVTMQDVVRSVQSVATIMAEIGTASDAQKEGVAHARDAVAQIDQATQQNAALVEQMSAAASSLQGQADELLRSVLVFRLG